MLVGIGEERNHYGYDAVHNKCASNLTPKEETIKDWVAFILFLGVVAFIGFEIYGVISWLLSL